MSRKKKNRNLNQITARILLATAFLNLMETLMDIIKKLFE